MHLCLFQPGRRLWVYSVLLMLPLAPACTFQVSSTPTPTIHTTIKGAPTQRLFGVLQPSMQHAATDQSAGIQLYTLEIGWDQYEPQDAVWNMQYIRQQQAKYAQFRSAGFKVVLDLGMQYPPAWAKEIRPWKDQYGNVGRAQVNAIWSPIVRQKIEVYIQHVFQDLGTDFWGVRLGSGGSVETLYPETPAGFRYSYWAFDDDAMRSNPVPLWHPGQPSPHGEALTFYTWYLQRLISTVNWQQNVVRRSYSGYLIQLLPGQGVRPAQWNMLIAANLIPTASPVYAAERGAVWDRLIDGITDPSHVIISCSSIGDDSATASSTNDAAGDPLYWSSAHWVAYNADRYKFPKIAENEGHNDAARLHIVFQQMMSYGYTSLLWAFQADLYSGQYATIDQYVELIAQVH